MKIFLDDFTIYNDMDTHLNKLTLCLQNCREFGINLNLDNGVFIIFLGMIMGFIVSNLGKLPNCKKIQGPCSSNACTHKSTTNLGIQWNGLVL
jgi:hypothetical protein